MRILIYKVVPRGQITDILMCDNRLVKKNGREVDRGLVPAILN